MIRLATPKDSRELLRLFHQLQPANPPAANGTAHIEAVLAHAGTSVFVAGDVALAGALVLHLLPNATYAGRPYGLIENVIVDGTCRGQGYGRALIEAAIKHAAQQKAYKLMLMSGHTRDAIGFYEKLGFSSTEKAALIKRF